MVFFCTATRLQWMSGWPHFSQDEIPCVFHVLHKFSVLFLHKNSPVRAEVV